MLRNISKAILNPGFIALLGLLAAFVAPILVLADTVDEAAFKQLLVNNSPWSVTWKNDGGTFAKGTHKLRFVVKDGTISGVFFDSDRGSGDMPLTNVRVTGSCIKFVTGQNPRTYNYCLRDGVLTGDYEGQSRSGDWYTGKATGKPTGT